MIIHQPEEQNRLEALRRYHILDTPPDGAFDHVTALAAHFFHTPIALVSLVDEDRIWFKSRHGLAVPQIDRVPGLCASVIFQDDAYVVKDALNDPRTLANPLVAGEMGLRFYAAAPLITHDGHRLGTFNIIDFTPRDFLPQEAASLHHFANIVMDQMELRLAAKQMMDSLGQALSHPQPPGRLKELITVCAWSKKIRVGEEWMSFEQFLMDHLGLMVTHGIHPDEVEKLLNGRD